MGILCYENIYYCILIAQFNVIVSYASLLYTCIQFSFTQPGSQLVHSDNFVG
jgi:hypothetical protein